MSTFFAPDTLRLARTFVRTIPKGLILGGCACGNNCSGDGVLHHLKKIVNCVIVSAPGSHPQWTSAADFDGARRTGAAATGVRGRRAGAREAVEALPPRARVSFLQGVFEGMSVRGVVVLREENAVLRRSWTAPRGASVTTLRIN